MGVTIKDIAAKVGLSASAVSLVLNDRPCRISKEKKEQIREVAQALHYAPNQAARSLVTKESRMLALILPDIENIFFSSLAKRIEDCCRREGYMLLIANSNDSLAQDEALLANIAARGVDGLFLIVSNESYRENAALTGALTELTVPYVMVDRAYEHLACDKVYFDNEKGAYLAVRHLIELGHTRIGCIANSSARNGQARLRGYCNAMEEAGLVWEPGDIVQGDYHLESGAGAARELIKTDVTAVFSSNDMMALGFLKELTRLGKRVPEDISLVGYDNALAQFALGVELTSVAQNPQELGEQASRLLINRLRGSGEPPQTVCLAPELVVRESVKRMK